MAEHETSEDILSNIPSDPEDVEYRDERNIYVTDSEEIGSGPSVSEDSDVEDMEEEEQFVARTKVKTQKVQERIRQQLMQGVKCK